LDGIDPILASIVYFEIAYDPMKPVLRTFPSESKIVNRSQATGSEDGGGSAGEFIGQLVHDKHPSPAHLKERILYVLVSQAKDNEAMLGSEEAGNLIAEMEFQKPACDSIGELSSKAVHYLECTSSTRSFSDAPFASA